MKKEEAARKQKDAEHQGKLKTLNKELD